MSVVVQQTASDALRAPSKLTYEKYITSTRWERRRAAYYANHERKCRACGSKDNIHLHHHTYARMGNELDVDLVPLCEEHHTLVHRFHHGAGVSLTAATRSFLKVYGTDLDVPTARPRSRPRRTAPAKPPAGYVTRAQAAKDLGIDEDQLPTKKRTKKGRFVRGHTVKQWINQPPRWLQDAREIKARGPRPQFRAVVYSGGGRPYSLEVQRLLTPVAGL